MIILGMNTGMVVFIPSVLAYLTAYPKLQCDGISCDIDTVCRNPEFLENPDKFIVEDSLQTLDNWTSEMGIYCISSWKMGLFGSGYLIGFAISGLFMRIGDQIG